MTPRLRLKAKEKLPEKLTRSRTVRQRTKHYQNFAKFPLMKWTKERSKRAHAAKARQRIEAAESGQTEPDFLRVERGTYLGTLTWQAADGQVRKWVITQGHRANNIAIVGRMAGSDGLRHGCTWSAFFARLRRCLVGARRGQAN